PFPLPPFPLLPPLPLPLPLPPGAAAIGEAVTTTARHKRTRTAIARFCRFRMRDRSFCGRDFPITAGANCICKDRLGKAACGYPAVAFLLSDSHYNCAQDGLIVCDAGGTLRARSRNAFGTPRSHASRMLTIA